MKSRTIIVAVSGGIAAYKSAILVSRLVQQGHDVWVVLTECAMQFVGKATFSALAGRPPVVSLFDFRFSLGAHIELGDLVELLIVAPATSRVLASFAHGSSDDLLATLYLNRTCPVLIAPAMSAKMWKQPAVQRNVEQLTRDGVHWVGPESGWLSCRQVGIGRMAEPEQILVAISNLIDAME